MGIRFVMYAKLDPDFVSIFNLFAGLKKGSRYGKVTIPSIVRTYPVMGKHRMLLKSNRDLLDRLQGAG